MTKQVPTLNDLVAMTVSDRVNTIKTLNKYPRGDLLREALAKLGIIHNNVTEHPYLIAAHKRAKRAEKRLRHTPDLERLARQEVKDVTQRMNKALHQLGQQADHSRTLEQQLTEASDLERTLRATIEDMQKYQNELIEHINRLHKGFNALQDLRLADLEAHVAEAKLLRLGFIIQNDDVN